MIKKLAVFVEGHTEQEFTIRLLTELAGKRGIAFEVQEQHHGQLSFVEIRTSNVSSTQPHEIQVLVANCCNDAQVKSQIKDRYNSLLGAGYSLIVGLRDVYPLSHSEINDLLRFMPEGLPKGAVPIHMHLAVMEIEAWFLEETTHFSRIDSAITSNEIIANGFDYQNSRAHELGHPAETLDAIYKSVGKRYSKNKRQIQRTVRKLSYEELYINTRPKAPTLDGFIATLEVGLFS